jgi:disulfide bond formation protein DsbB
MLTAIIGFSRRRTAWLLLAGTALGLEITALYFQHVLQLDPCVLCVYERVAVLGILVAGLLGAIAPRRAALRWLAFAIWASSAAWGMGLALEHTGLQFGDGLNLNCSFFADFPRWAKLDEWWPSVFAPTGYCDDIQWLFLGLSIPQWMLVIFGSYLTALAVVILSQFAAANRRTV